MNRTDHDEGIYRLADRIEQQVIPLGLGFRHEVVDLLLNDIYENVLDDKPCKDDQKSRKKLPGRNANNLLAEFLLKLLDPFGLLDGLFICVRFF